MKLFYPLGILTIGIATVLVGVLIFMFAQEDGFIQVKEPIQVSPERIKRGEELAYIIDYKKTRDITARSTRFVECADGNLVMLTAGASLPVGERVYTATFTVPEKASASTCILSITVEYQINPIKSITKRFVSEPFEIYE